MKNTFQHYLLMYNNYTYAFLSQTIITLTLKINTYLSVCASDILEAGNDTFLQ
jgi:hypothetical protein